MRKRTQHIVRVVVLGVTLVAPAIGSGEGGGTPPTSPKNESRSPWGAVLQEGTRAGVPRKSMEGVISRLARGGVSPELGRVILWPAFEAARTGLPEESVLAKVEEGLLKSVPPEGIALASRNRYESLHSAEVVLSDAWGPVKAKRAPGLLTSLALAMESGIPEPSLRRVLQKGRGKPVQLVKSVVEGGETLHLADFEPDVVEQLMGDCLDRNLRRQDVLRVVRYASERKRSGTDSREVREALWGRKGGGPLPR